MIWMLKAMTQKLLSALPAGERINHYCQRYISRNYPLKEEVFRGYLKVAGQHLASYQRHREKHDLGGDLFLEFGSGWDLLVPLMFYAAGVERQLCIDIQPLLRLDLVNNNMRRINANREAYGDLTGCYLRAFPPNPLDSLSDLESQLGITYRAPVDIRNSGFSDESFDFISSSKVLEHVPSDHIPAILSECRRMIKKDGIVGLDIDMGDHFAQADPCIKYFNFLKYDDGSWNRLQSSINYQNRLRFPDYQGLLLQAGFELLQQDVMYGNPEELAALGRCKLAPRFEGKYSLMGLGAKVAHFALRKRFYETN